MLALTTYIESLPFIQVDYIISYKRGLLFYYLYAGEFPDAFTRIIDN